MIHKISQVLQQYPNANLESEMACMIIAAAIASELEMLEFVAPNQRGVNDGLA